MDAFFRICLLGECDNLLPSLFVSSFKPQVSTSSVGTFPKRVKIVEVGARDGLQNEKVKMEISHKRFLEQSELPVVGAAGMDRARQDMITPRPPAPAQSKVEEAWQVRVTVKQASGVASLGSVSRPRAAG